jgi:hypothetical protein
MAKNRGLLKVVSEELGRRDAEIDRLRAALYKYGDHTTDCMILSGEWVCICGYDAALQSHSSTSSKSDDGHS